MWRLTCGGEQEVADVEEHAGAGVLSGVALFSCGASVGTLPGVAAL